MSEAEVLLWFLLRELFIFFVITLLVILGDEK
jgi:hypothetical protein